MELTAAGRTLLSHALPILASVETAWRETRRTGLGELGRLKVAYTPTVAHEALPLLTSAMHERFPAVQLRTCEMWQADSVVAVETGRFDVGLARSPSLTPELRSTVVREEPLGVMLGEGHRLVGDVVVETKELSGETLMIWPRDLSPGYYDLVVESMQRTGFAGPIREFENLSPNVFVGDPVARTEVAACRAFSVGFRTEPLPPGFVWRVLEPAPRIPLDLFWKAPAGALVESFVGLACDVAERERWLDERLPAPPVGSATPRAAD